MYNVHVTEKRYAVWKKEKKILCDHKIFVFAQNLSVFCHLSLKFWWSLSAICKHGKETHLNTLYIKTIYSCSETSAQASWLSFRTIRTYIRTDGQSNLKRSLNAPKQNKTHHNFSFISIRMYNSARRLDPLLLCVSAYWRGVFFNSLVEKRVLGRWLSATHFSLLNFIENGQN